VRCVGAQNGARSHALARTPIFNTSRRTRRAQRGIADMSETAFFERVRRQAAATLAVIDAKEAQAASATGGDVARARALRAVEEARLAAGGVEGATALGRWLALHAPTPGGAIAATDGVVKVAIEAHYAARSGVGANALLRLRQARDATLAFRPSEQPAVASLRCAAPSSAGALRLVDAARVLGASVAGLAADVAAVRAAAPGSADGAAVASVAALLEASAALLDRAAAVMGASDGLFTPTATGNGTRHAQLDATGLDTLVDAMRRLEHGDGPPAHGATDALTAVPPPSPAAYPALDGAPALPVSAARVAAIRNAFAARNGTGHSLPSSGEPRRARSVGHRGTLGRR
jgi:hypothetical protein